MSGALALGLAGCAVGRQEIDVAVPPVQAAAPRQMVTIIEIRDLRPFKVNPGNREMPSLAREAEIKDGTVTGRTIGRTRNAYGMRLGDVVLPPGETVTSLVRGAVTAALREKGYVVVADPAPDVLPLSVDIEQFWAWFEPGLLAPTLEFDSHLRLYGSDVLDRTPTFARGRGSLTTALATTNSWKQVIQQGLDNLVLSIKENVEPAGAPPRDIATLPPH